MPTLFFRSIMDSLSNILSDFINDIFFCNYYECKHKSFCTDGEMCSLIYGFNCRNNKFNISTCRTCIHYDGMGVNLCRHKQIQEDYIISLPE